MRNERVTNYIPFCNQLEFAYLWVNSLNRGSVYTLVDRRAIPMARLDGGWNWVERPGKVLDIIALGGVQVPPLEYPSAWQPVPWPLWFNTEA